MCDEWSLGVPVKRDSTLPSAECWKEVSPISRSRPVMQSWLSHHSEPAQAWQYRESRTPVTHQHFLIICWKLKLHFRLCIPWAPLSIYILYILTYQTYRVQRHARKLAQNLTIFFYYHLLIYSMHPIHHHLGWVFSEMLFCSSPLQRVSSYISLPGNLTYRSYSSDWQSYATTKVCKLETCLFSRLQ